MDSKGDYNKIIILLLVVFVVLLVVGMVFFNPFKTQSRLSVTSASDLNEGDELSILLCDDNSSPIPNQSVQISFKDSNGSVTQKSVITNAEGVGVISLNGLASGQYSVNVTYVGNSTFKASDASQNLNIIQKVVETTSSDSTIDAPYHPGFTPSYREGPLVYGYKGDRWGFITPTGNFFEM